MFGVFIRFVGAYRFGEIGEIALTCTVRSAAWLNRSIF